MCMTDYIAEIQRQLVTKYGFPARGDYPEIPQNIVPDGVYPMTIEGKIDYVKITRGEINCCNWEIQTMVPTQSKPAESSVERDRLIHHYDRWFKRVKHEFCPLLLPYAGKPVNYVEIGCWAGGSAEWVCKNILTHPDSKGAGIDPYPTERRHPESEILTIKKLAHDRVAATGAKWKWYLDPSIPILRWLTQFPFTIDILYIDGDHDGHAVVQDFALAWPMLKVGSLVIFDDYAIREPKRFPNVKEGYDAIEMAWRGLIEPIGKHRTQRAVTVIKKSHT